MSRKAHLLWNIAASLIAVVLLATTAGRLKAYLLPSPAQSEASQPAASDSAHPAQQPATSSGGGAREGAPHEAESHGGEPHSESGSVRNEIILWVNFLLVAGGVWYLCKKFLGPFLHSRGQAIREDMERSSRALEEAARRLSGIEDKLKQLDVEIASLRSSALQEASAERARIEEMAQGDAHKIALAAEQEIVAAAKVARQELKVYAAELAIGMAEKKIQESISAQSEKGIFRSFIEDLSDSSRSGNAGGTS